MTHKEWTAILAWPGYRVYLIHCLTGPTFAEPADEDEARAYVKELIASEVLVSSLAPPVTGDPPLDDIVSQLESVASDRAVAEKLSDARRALADIDREGVGAPAHRYRKIASELESLPADVEISRLFQVDMIKPASGASLPETVVAEITSCASSSGFAASK